jgi:hypothetical protein
MIPRTSNLLATGLAATLTVTLPRSYAAAVRELFKLAKVALPQLGLTVDVPPTWRPFLADDLAEAFASRVANVFRRQGFTGKVKFVAVGEPDEGKPMLAIQLIHWRLRQTENAECTFTATVNSGGQEESLGTFEHTTLVWIRGMNRWGLVDALGDAADGALRDLARQLAMNGTVPGFAVGQTM